jgi:cytochrome c oxidase cbb3-type subunit III
MRSISRKCLTFVMLLAQAPPGAGPADKQTVDAAAADSGKTTYIAECITCHGARARGSENGPDLVRSLVVLRDRYGSEIGPFLRKGHPTQSNTPSANFTQKQIEGLSHFLKQRFNETLRSSPTLRVQNVLTGNPKAGAEYFNGAGRCNTCHSSSGDLAGIGKKYDPPASGPPVSGALVRIDDFNVSLRDASGEYWSWKRSPELKIERNDPYATHVELLDKLTDKNIHDVVAYLESLK